MNDKDRKRFSRYYPGYIEQLEELEISDSGKTQEKKNQDKDITDKKNILGYIDKINIDKNKLVMDTIMDSNVNSNLC